MGLYPQVVKIVITRRVIYVYFMIINTMLYQTFLSYLTQPTLNLIELNFQVNLTFFGSIGMRLSEFGVEQAQIELK